MPTAQEIAEEVNALRARLASVELDNEETGQPETLWLAEGDLLLDAADLIGLARARLEALEPDVDADAARERAEPDHLVVEKGADNKPRLVTDWPIRWCVDRRSFPEPGRYARVVASMQSAIAEWESVCNVRFSYEPERDERPGLPTADGLIVCKLPTVGEAIATAFFPWDAPWRRRLRLAEAWFSETLGFDPVGVLRHEIGHIIGFRHEHIRSGAPAECGRESGDLLPLGIYDPQSVMHYFCGGVGSRTLELTHKDRYYAHQMYPRDGGGPTVSRPEDVSPPPPVFSTPGPALVSFGVTSPIPETHFINLGADGVLSDRGGLISTEAQVAGAIDAALASGQPHLTLHFHGGLVSESQAIGEADDRLPRLTEALGTHPVFVVWETGPIETLQQVIADIVETPLFRFVSARMRKWLARQPGPVTFAVPNPTPELEVALEAVEGEWVIANPIALDLLGEHIRQPADPASFAAFEAELRAGGALSGLAAAPANARAFSSAIPDAFQVISGAREAFERVVERFATRRDHGFHATIVEELLRALYADRVGVAIWGKMKANAAAAYAPGGGMRHVLDLLSARLAQRPDLKVHVVAHSAGSIHASHLVRTLGETWPVGRGLDSLTFLVPAVDVDTFDACVVPHGDRFARFQCLSLDDTAERTDALIPGAPAIYPSSILYFVSGVCEAEADHPILGMQRFLEQGVVDTPALRRTRRFLARRNLSWPAQAWSPGAADLRFFKHAGVGGPWDDPLMWQKLANVTRTV